MARKDPTVRNEVRHDLRFHMAGNFGDYISVKDVHNESLKPAWLTFQHNIESLRNMARLPQVIATDAVDYLIPLTQAIFNVTGTPVTDDPDIDANLDAISDEFNQIVFNFFMGKRRTQKMLYLGFLAYTSQSLSTSWHLRGALFSFLESQIIGVWTAFDTLTTDLLIAAISSQPKCLYNLGRTEIPLSALIDAGVDQDWSGRMGELARLFIRADHFQSKRDAYRQLFKDSSIDKLLGSPDVKMTQAVRNSCIHDASIATANFIRQAKAWKMEPWQSVQIGELIPINGRDISALSEGVIHCANDLVRALDGWIGLPAGQAPKPQGQGQ